MQVMVNKEFIFQSKDTTKTTYFPGIQEIPDDVISHPYSVQFITLIPVVEEPETEVKKAGRPKTVKE